MPEQIFISYRRDDAAYVTGHINDLLRKEFGDESVFTDVDNIALGVDFRAVLDQTVSQCQVLLAVIGSGWLSASDREGNRRLKDPADFVRIEIESALKRNIPVIPLLVSGAKMPAAEDLPGSLQGLAFRNGIQIRPAPDFGVDMARLIRNLRSHFESIRTHEPGIAIPAEPRPAETPVSKPKPADVGTSESKSADESDAPADKFELEESDRARKRAELERQKKKKPRGRAAVWLTAVVVLAAGGWYYTNQNPDAIQALLGVGGSAAPATDPEPAAGDDMEEVQTIDDSSSVVDVTPAAQGVTVEEAAPGIGIDTEAVGEEAAAEDLESAAGAGTIAEDLDELPDGSVDEAVAVAQPAEGAPAEASEQAESALSAEPAPAEEAAEPVAAATEEAEDADAAPLETDDEITLTPGSQRLSDSSEYISEGVRLAAIDDHEGAIEYFDQAIELGVQPAFAYKQRAASYVALGQHEAAISDFTEAIALNNEDLNAWYSRGSSYLVLQDYAAAIADFDAVIQIDPEFVDAYTKRASAHEALGNTEAAVRDRSVVEVFESNRDNPR
jgi:tetratricopeptide (TPR) repeat protein